MKWTTIGISRDEPRDDNYWRQLWTPNNKSPLGRYYIVLQLWKLDEWWVSPRTSMNHDDDIGPYESLEAATAAAEMLNAMEGL